MSDPGAPSGAVAETTTTAGTGPYQLNPNPPNALSGFFRFADVFADGATITYEVDDTAKKEIVTGAFDRKANTLSRDTVLFSSNANALVDWPATGQRMVRPLVSGNLTVTDGTTTVTNVTTLDFISGAVVTDGGGGTADVAITGGGPDDDTCDMQVINSGTSV